MVKVEWVVKIDWFFIILILIALSCVIIISFELYKSEKAECISDPIGYAEEIYGDDFVLFQPDFQLAS